MEMSGQRLGFVGLDGANEVPNQSRFLQGLLFAQSFLQVIFTEIPLTCRVGFRQCFRWLGFAYRHQAHAACRSLRREFGGVDALLYQFQSFCDGVHEWFETVVLYFPPFILPLVPAVILDEVFMDISELLAFSVKNGASDLHLSAGLPPMIRVDGDIRRINVPPLDHKEVHSLIYDIMNDRQRRDFEEFFETDFSFELPGVARFRVNAFTHDRGAAGVFRTIPTKILTLEDLGCPTFFQEVTRHPRGLILVTGPTGSGKSTTLASMVDYINSNDYSHILTIEDPIEFVHLSKKCLINQREVHRDTLGFSEALRSALREDPDVILVGELRDLETIRLALTAAETGHLVFGTLHTSSAAKTIDRIIDVFPAAEKSMIRSMLSESLQAVISQTLMKKVSGGRTAAWEIMVGTSAIRNLIREDKVAQMYSAIQTGRKDGMQTLDQHLTELVDKGVVSRQSARSKAMNKDAFR
jgi:twitching motility protein PilT